MSFKKACPAGTLFGALAILGVNAQAANINIHVVADPSPLVSVYQNTLNLTLEGTATPPDRIRVEGWYAGPGLRSSADFVNNVAAHIENRSTIEVVNRASHFVNYGSIANRATFQNDGELWNYSGVGSTAAFNNYGTLNSSFYFDNYASVTNESTGTFNNSGTFWNHQNFTNRGSINNAAGAYLSNAEGRTMTNMATANIDNQGTLRNHGTMNQYGSIANASVVEISDSGRIQGNGTYTQTAGSTVVNLSLIHISEPTRPY